MKKLRILVLVHEDLVPPDDASGVPESEVDVYRTEFDVVSSLRDSASLAGSEKVAPGAIGAGSDG